MKDEYISAEHLFLAALGRKNGEAAQAPAGWASPSNPCCRRCRACAAAGG
jgi:hypothetical protein